MVHFATMQTGSLFHRTNALSVIHTCPPLEKDSPKPASPTDRHSTTQLFTAPPLGGLKQLPIQQL